MDKYGCFLQALTFLRLQVLDLAHFLDRRGFGFVDSLAEEYADAERLGRWALVPPVFQHVGERSSKDDDFGEGALATERRADHLELRVRKSRPELAGSTMIVLDGM